jgi:hypothetical protein
MRLGSMRQVGLTNTCEERGRGVPDGSRSGMLAAFVACSLMQAFVGSTVLAGQASPAPNAGVTPTPAAATAHTKNTSKSHANVAAAQPAAPVAVAPPDPPPPDWPANDQPSEATVTWDSHGLRVVAANSSLSQIMKAISTQTGATLEGFGKDERVFGIYGPGTARDVIRQLLDGSGYNVLMVGDQGQGTPRQIILTAQSGASPTGPKAGNQNPNEEDNEAEEQAQEPEPPPPPQPQPPAPSSAAPGVPVRSQQQIIDQMQERQRQIQQQQQNPQ